MELYSAIEFHSNNSHVAIIDDQQNRLFYRKLANDAKLIASAFTPYRERLKGIVIESTLNWYWLTDLLIEIGYSVHLGNPCGIQKYSGLKHADDKHDAFWLAQMLALNILPEGYIYPKEDRPLRDLLRKRAHLVRARPSLVLSLSFDSLSGKGALLSSSPCSPLRETELSTLSSGETSSGWDFSLPAYSISRSSAPAG